MTTWVIGAKHLEWWLTYRNSSTKISCYDDYSKRTGKTMQKLFYSLYIHVLMEPTYLDTTDIPALTCSKQKSSFSSAFFTVSVNETNFQLLNQNPGAVFSSHLSHCPNRRNHEQSSTPPKYFCTFLSILCSQPRSTTASVLINLPGLGS